jgi:hypothetical protein
VQVVAGVVGMLRGGKIEIAIKPPNLDVHRPQARRSVLEVSKKFVLLLIGELDKRVEVRMVDDDARRPGGKGVDLFGTESELEIVHRRRGFFARQSLLVFGTSPEAIEGAACHRAAPSCTSARRVAIARGAPACNSDQVT